MEISLSDNIHFSIRQSASTLLYQYIEKHWSEDMLYCKFEPPEVSASVKPLIRGYLLKSLCICSSDTNPRELNKATRTLLNKYSQSISKIAQVDWPQNWPELFPVLQGYLSSDSPSAVYSTLMVFKELSNEIIDNQIPHISPILLPHMLDIITAIGHFTIHERINAVKTFSQLAETIIIMDDYQQDAIKIYLAPYIPRYVEAVINILMVPDNSPDVGIGLKKCIVENLAQFVKHCRKYTKVYIPKLMELIWHTLTSLANVYVIKVVNSDSFDQFGPDAAAVKIYGDSDDDEYGDNVGLVSYVLAIIDFVLRIFESAKYREMIRNILPDLFYYIILYTQITDDQVCCEFKCF